MFDEASKENLRQEYRTAKMARKLIPKSTSTNSRETKQVKYVSGEREAKTQLCFKPNLVLVAW